MNEQLSTRSNSSATRRKELKEKFVTVPEATRKVSYRNYVKYASSLYSSGMEAYQRHDYEHAYIDLMKVTVLLFERLPTHPDYKAVQKSITDQAKEIKDYVDRAKKSSVYYLELIVIKLDEQEDFRLKHQKELALIDAFDEFEDEFENVNTADHQHNAEEVNGVTEVIQMEEQNNQQQQEQRWSKDHLNILDSALNIPPVIPPSSSHPSLAHIEVAPPSLNAGTDDVLGGGVQVTSGTYIDEASTVFRDLRPTSVALLGAHDRAILHHIGDFTKFFIPTPSISPVNIMIGRNTYVFNQDDFHVSFSGFLLALPPELQMTDSVLEANRCFFIHLGIAVGIHPFAFQCAFRMFASAERKYVEDWVKEVISTINNPGAFIDANALNFLWPEEFNQYRICFISGSLSSPIISCFTPHESVVQETKAQSKELQDIILRCNGSHFTLLRPLITDSGRFAIIDDLIADARDAGLVVQVSSAQRRMNTPNSTNDAALALIKGATWERSVAAALRSAMSPLN